MSLITHLFTHTGVDCVNFYMPIWKIVVICCCNVRLSVCPSKFSRLFFNMLWDINLKLGIYTFSRWHDMSSLSFHHSWVTLTYFTAKNWSNYFFFNHGLINLDKSFKFCTLVALCILPDISSIIHKNLIFWIFVIIFVHFLKKFLGGFHTCFEISVWSLFLRCHTTERSRHQGAD